VFRIGKPWLILILGMFASDESVPGPRIVSISPTSGPEGARVTITGKNLLDTSSVSFGKYESTFKVVSPEKLIAIAPRWVKTSPVAVNTRNGSEASPFEFVVQNDPRIPDDVGWKAGYVNPVRPPSDFKAVLPWGIAIADSRSPRAEVQVAKLSL